MVKNLSIFIFIVFLISCNNSDNANSTHLPATNNEAPPLISYNLIKVFPHDTTSYTEGLIYYNNALYESFGNYGKSGFAKINLQTGDREKIIKLDPKYFGEGITIFNNKIYQLTWQEKKVFVYDINTLQKINELSWPLEGWGMTHSNDEIIISTGSSNLYFVNPENFSINKTVGITDNYGPVSNLNELEYVDGIVYANQYLTNNILKIDAETGKVLGKIDLTGILNQSGIVHDPAYYALNSGNVLNGIAYDSAHNSLLITGKYWPALFEIKLEK